MLPVFLLIGIEKIVNLALATDPITQTGLQSLSGKSMRLIMNEPPLEFDTIFNDQHIRFEPVTTSVFEPKGTNNFAKPDCIVTVDNPVHLLHLMGEPSGNLPIEGDYKILMQVKQLIAGFDADIIGKLQPLIGVPLASQLHTWVDGVKQLVATPAKQAFADISEMANWQAKNHADDLADYDDLKQKLLRLRADVEREEAKLAVIKAEQNKAEQAALARNND